MKSKIFILKAAQIVVYSMSLLILLFVTVNSLLYYTDMKVEDFVFTDICIRDNPLMLLVLVTVISLIVCLLCHAIKRVGEIGNHILFSVLFMVVMGGCAWWIVNSRSVPTSDSKAVYDIAIRAMNHDLLPIAPTDSYMSLWPFQSGMLLYCETILRCIPNADYVTIQWFNWASVGLALVSGYFLVRRWFQTEGTVTFWCMILMFCLPYYLLVNYVYGDVPGIGLSFFAAWMLTEFLQRKKEICLLLGAAALGGGIALRKNFLIFAVACILVLGVMFWAGRKKRFLVCMVCVALAAFLANTLPIKFYEHRAHNTMGNGVPAVSYIAMGLQGTGGWNGYHSDLYMRCGFQAEEAKKISIQSVKDSMAQMRADPIQAVQFFYQKQVGQWCNETYGFTYETVYGFDDRTQEAWDIYCGKWTTPVLKTMNVYQSAVYLGALLYCVDSLAKWIRNRKKKESILDSHEDFWKLVWLVTMIGGFLFSMIWEAAARYTLIYLVMLTPYSAEGLYQESCKLLTVIKKCAKNTYKLAKRSRQMRTGLECDTEG